MNPVMATRISFQHLEQGNKARNTVYLCQKPAQLVLIISIFIGVQFCWSQAVLAFETWRGEVITNVNLRKSPGLNGEIITRLKKGDVVLVENQDGEWKNILLEKETYGYRGWVYEKYLKRVGTEEATPAFPLDETMTEAPLSQETANTPLKDKVVSEGPLPENEAKKETVVNPEESAFPGGSITDAPVISTQAKDARVDMTGTRKTATIDSPLEDAEKEKTSPYQVLGVFLKIILNLSTVGLSCAAVLLSCRAIQLANIRQRG